MAIDRTKLPWEFLDEYKEILGFNEWPTIPQMFNITVSRHGHKAGFTSFEGPSNKKVTLSYYEVAKKVISLAIWMNENGIQKGDKIAVSGKNSPEWGIVFLATLFAGGIVIPLDYALRKPETDNLLKTAKPKLFFVDEDKYIEYSKEKNDFKLYSLNANIQETYVYNLKSLNNDQTCLVDCRVSPDDIAAILFTSGTTGTPKGVMLTHNNFVSDCYIAQTNFNISYKDTFYALLPIHHAYTMQAVFIESLSVGAEIVFGKTLAPSRMIKELEEGQITMFLGVPLLFNKLLAGIMKGVREKGAFVYYFIRFLMRISYIIKKTTGKSVGHKMFKGLLQKAHIYSIRTAISGGGPLANKVFRDYQALGIDFIQGYGLTETSPIVALNPSEHFKIESVGRNFKPYMDMKIDNPNEQGIGEILIKGPMVMKGYYNMPEETAKVIDSDGWFHTGDLGWLDDEDYLILCGRAKNMIVTDGGKNVYPEEIENAFQMVNEIGQITVQGYTENDESKAEFIEALIYPSDFAYELINKKREDSEAIKIIRENIENSVDRINKTLLPYQRITKITILDEPLKMTTSQKVIRNYKK